ncbi:hypothetical protein OG529_04350 [Streptomyces longwoodensis]|uniref:hypothetical protein n=1 Tax=Streptomyces longwoodensis TaxID=68231 RepID=UPI00325607E1
MARLQILELPEGTDDERPPFALVVDQCAADRWVSRPGNGDQLMSARWREAAELLGARGVIVTAETVEIPANDLSAEFREGLQASVGDVYEAARTSLSESETLGHKLLQRAEQAEEVAAHTKALMERRTRTLLERAEAAEEKLAALAEQDTERMDQVTDALGFDRLRDWDEIVSAIKRQRQIAADGEHVFDEPGYEDPQRCAQCGLDLISWASRRDTRTCSTVRSDAESGHDFRPLGPRGELECLRCRMPRIEWATRRDTPRCDVVRQGGE